MSAPADVRPRLRLVNDGRPWWQRRPCPSWCSGHEDDSAEDAGTHCSEPLFQRRARTGRWRPGFTIMSGIEHHGSPAADSFGAEILITTLVARSHTNDAAMSVIRMKPAQAVSLAQDLLRLAEKAQS